MHAELPVTVSPWHSARHSFATVTPSAQTGSYVSAQLLQSLTLVVLAPQEEEEGRVPRLRSTRDSSSDRDAGDALLRAALRRCGAAMLM